MTFTNVRSLAAGFLAAIISTFVFGSGAEAVPITEIDGVIGQFTLTSPGLGMGPASLSINNTVTAVTALNGTVVPGGFGGFIPTTFAPMNISIDPNNPDIINFDMTKTIGPGGPDLDSNGVTGTAVFDANLSIIDFPTPQTMVIQGNEVLLGSTSSLDFSQFGVGSIVFTFNVANPNSLFDTLINGGSVTGSGSFSQSNVPFGVPEPHAVALWLVIGTISIGAGGRLMNRRKI